MLVGLSVEVLARLALVLLLAARLIERIPKFSAVSSILHTCVICCIVAYIPADVIGLPHRCLDFALRSCDLTCVTSAS